MTATRTIRRAGPADRVVVGPSGREYRLTRRDLPGGRAEFLVSPELANVGPGATRPAVAVTTCFRAALELCD